jgi:hypothetical protein
MLGLVKLQNKGRQFFRRMMTAMAVRPLVEASHSVQEIQFVSREPPGQAGRCYDVISAGMAVV